MRKLTITLTDEQYEFAKSKGRLWLRGVVQAYMDHGVVQDAPIKPKWWRFW